MKLKYDVIIIGGGPADLKCAETLGKDSNLSVLLLEKNNTIGPKICAGGISPKCQKILKKYHEYKDVLSFKKLYVYVENKKKTIQKDNHKILLQTIDRKSLGQIQLKQLNKYNNVDVLKGHEVKKISHKYILCNNKKIYYNYLIGADGSNSVVRKYLKISTKKIHIAFQYKIKTDKFNDVEIHFNPKKFYSFYAWIFPHKNFVSIGSGYDANSKKAKEIIDNFHTWLEEKNINYEKSKLEFFPINYDFQGYKFDNIYLVGDAAGLASGLSGEGIYQAITSGKEIAQYIINPHYKSEIMQKIIKKHKKQSKITQFLIHNNYIITPFYSLSLWGLKFKYLKNKALSLFL